MTNEQTRYSNYVQAVSKLWDNIFLASIQSGKSPQEAMREANSCAANTKEIHEAKAEAIRLAIAKEFPDDPAA